MIEISWLAFYLILHLLLAMLLLPALLLAGRSRLKHQPATMLKLWQIAAALLVLFPILLLQPWALDQQLMPWFQASVSPVLEQSSSIQGSANLPVTGHAVQQVHWPLMSQLVYLLAPAFWLWLILPAGALVRATKLLAGYYQARRLRQEASLVSSGHLTSPVPVLQHPAIHSAMLVGLRKPQILLPARYLQNLSSEQLGCVIGHELCHLQHQDLRAFLLQQVVGCLFWWSPAWRLIANQLDLWRELRCDAEASIHQGDPVLYAQTLLDCAVSATQQRNPVAFFAQHFLRQAVLTTRIDAVLQPRLPSPVWLFAAISVAFLLWCIASLMLVQQWQLAELPAKHAQVRLSQLKPLAELLEAVQANNPAQVVALLQQGAPLDLPMPGDGNALMVAVRRQLPEMVYLLLSRGADPNVSSRGDGNALIIASQLGNLSLARQLIAAGADVNAVVLADETALINASARGDLAMLQLLLSHGALINLQVETPLSDGPEIRSALNRAANDQTRQFLLTRGAR
jgi:beta-lactamase regulating signal transducer with metallopeptidase domain